MLKRTTVSAFAKRKRENEKIVMITAYDAPSAAAAADAGIDVLLVGDSLAPTVLGYRNTLPVTMEQMLHHTAAVRRGAPNAFVVFDLPFMSYQESMEKDLLINEPIDKVVMHYAKNASIAGLDGVVCSPLEAEKVHSTCGKDFITVTPGVRFADGEIGDQKRVMTPEEAKKIGSDYIVVGRPITGAEDPVAAYKRCVAEFVG